MDEEAKAYLDAMMVQLTDKFERILDEIGTRRSDLQNMKGFLLEDAIVMGRRTLTIEQRLSQLEKKSKND